VDLRDRACSVFYLSGNCKLSTYVIVLDDTQISVSLRHQIFCLFKTTLKDLLQLGQSKSPIVNCVFFPALSGRPAIFQLFLGLATSAPQFLHLTISSSSIKCRIHVSFMMNKRFAFHCYSAKYVVTS
jgi:hypothetical protein